MTLKSIDIIINVGVEDNVFCLLRWQGKFIGKYWKYTVLYLTMSERCLTHKRHPWFYNLSGTINITLPLVLRRTLRWKGWSHSPMKEAIRKSSSIQESYTLNKAWNAPWRIPLARFHLQPLTIVYSWKELCRHGLIPITFLSNTEYILLANRNIHIAFRMVLT